MDILAQLQALVGLINELQAKLVDAEAALNESVKVAYDKGFADGVASVPPVVSEKIYTQEELDAKIQEALLPLQAKVAELEVVVSGIDQKIADGVAMVKSELLIKYNELQVAETAAEVGFADLLK